MGRRRAGSAGRSGRRATLASWRSQPRRAPAATALAGAALLAVAACELAHLLAARTCAERVDPDRPVALIVLGCPSRRGGRASAMQRWRVDIALRSLSGRRAPARPQRSAPAPRLDPELEPDRDPGSVVVFTGAARKPGRPEAEAMARYARRRGLPEAAELLEERSRSTWENIELALEVVGEPQQVAICSDPLHAARGRRYVRRQRPELTSRLVRADDYRPLEHPLLKIASVAYEVPRIAWIRRRQIVPVLPLRPIGGR